MDVKMEEEASTSSLHVDNANRSVWLLKVPAFVAKRWRADCQKAAKSVTPFELGRVRITQNATEASGSGISLQLAPAQDGGSMPQNFSLSEQTGNITPTLVFADLQGRLSAEGRVKRKFDLVVQQGRGDLDPEYRRLNRDRVQAAAAKTRTIKMLDEDPRSNGPVRPAGYGQRISFSNKGEKPKKKFERGQFERRARMEKDALESLLFRLFERQDLWTFVRLQQETDQPEVWLKEVLGDIGIQHKRGPNAKLWELKPEYKGGGGGQDA